jgi:hypothetical protein
MNHEGLVGRVEGPIALSLKDREGLAEKQRASLSSYFEIGFRFKAYRGDRREIARLKEGGFHKICQTDQGL